jgi:tripartite-type tricarboxylate transporter receptor subunit TctC
MTERLNECRIEHREPPMKRRHLLAAGLGGLAAPALARADSKYPERTVRLVIPFAPAGPTDIIGRMVAEKMTPLLGQTMIVDNKAGAAGSIGAMEVKRAKPDGYSLLFATSSTHAINPTAFARPPYDPVKDFTPISSICVNPLVLVTHPSMPPSIPALAELMKQNPGKYSYASSGIGSILHLAGEYFKREMGGMNVVHVPYKGSGPALQDVMAGNVAWMFETFSTTLQQHRAGKLRILAYAHSMRAPIAPEIPTMSEAGVKGYEAYTFNLIVGPAGVPQNVVASVDQATRKLMADASVGKFLDDIAAVPITDTTPERTAAFIKNELAKWAPVIHAAGVRIE